MSHFPLTCVVVLKTAPACNIASHESKLLDNEGECKMKNSTVSRTLNVIRSRENLRFQRCHGDTTQTDAVTGADDVNTNDTDSS